MQVFVKGYNSYGTVLKELKNNLYEIQIGIATVKVNKEDLVKDNNKTNCIIKVFFVSSHWKSKIILIIC